MKKIAIIGASYLQLPLVEKAKEMGIYTICFAWENGAVAKDICDRFYPISIIEKEEILEKCILENINGICTIASDIAVETVNYVAEALNLVGNSFQSALWTSNKLEMKKIWMENNISSPKFVQNIKEVTEKKLNYPLIVKPANSSGSKGVQVVINERDLEDSLTRAKSFSRTKEYIIEEYVSGAEFSIESISFQGQHKILGVTQKITSEAPYFVELEHYFPYYFKPDLQKKIYQELLQILDLLQIQNGASHAEIKVANDGAFNWIEIGARMGGDFIGSDLVELSTGFDYVKAVVEICLGQFTFPEQLNYQNKSGIYFYAENHCNTTELESQENIKMIRKEVNQPLIIPDLQNSNDRFGYLIFQSELDRK